MVRMRTTLVVFGFGLLAGLAPALSPQVAGADLNPPSVAEAARQLDQAQARLGDLNNQVEQTQAQLDALNRQLDADRATELAISDQLKQLARFQYTQPSLAIQLLDAGSFNEFLGDLAQARILDQRKQALLEQQRAVRQRDERTREAIQADLARIEAARRDAQAVAASARAALAAAQAEDLRQRAAALAAQAGATAAGGSGPNHFAFGYCTWYVANRRYIPWYGNAAEWWPNARAYGYAEGQTPQVGAVMVTQESSIGHVAYVESVNPDGSWTVSEMNYRAWGVVDQRTIRPGQVPLIGFIYGKP